MRCDRLDRLYGRLMDNTNRLENALGEAEPEVLVRLSEEHRMLMDAISGSGFSKDPELLQVVTDAHRQALKMMEGLQERLNETGRELKTAGNRKKLIGAYGRKSEFG